MSNAEPIQTETPFKGFLNQFTGLTSIMTDEDRTAQYAFVRGFIRDLAPQGPVEIHFARTVGLDSWRLNRIKAVEENIFAYGQVLPNKHFTSEIPQVEHAIGHAHTYMRFAESLNRISLYESRLNRSIARNLDLLLKLQARRTSMAPSRAATANNVLTMPPGPSSALRTPTPEANVASDTPADSLGSNCQRPGPIATDAESKIDVPVGASNCKPEIYPRSSASIPANSGSNCRA
jgi:hypothetical protein